MRNVITRVLPLPAPASSNTGPSTASTPSRCCGFNFSSRWSTFVSFRQSKIETTKDTKEHKGKREIKNQISRTSVKNLVPATWAWLRRNRLSCSLFDSTFVFLRVLCGFGFLTYPHIRTRRNADFSVFLRSEE